MLLIQERCPAVEHPDDELVLPFDSRQRGRLRTHLVSGEEVGPEELTPPIPDDANA